MDENPYILKNSYQCPPPDTWKGCGFIFLFKRGGGAKQVQTEAQDQGQQVQILETTSPSPSFYSSSTLLPLLQ